MPSTDKKPHGGGSTIGRMTKRNRTGCPGIRFEWIARKCMITLHVVATWTNAQHRRCKTSYSVEVHGLEEALDLAIAARLRFDGAPVPDRPALLEKLRLEYATNNDCSRDRERARLAGQPARVA